MYTPVALLPLPRKSCPYRVAGEERKTRNIIATDCGGETLACGFCVVHEYCHDTLTLLAAIGFPELRVNASLLVYRGVASWEEYILRLPAPGFRFNCINLEHTPGHVEVPRFTQLFMVADDYRKSVHPGNKQIAETFTRFQVRYFSEERHVERPSTKKASHSTMSLNFGSQSDMEHVTVYVEELHDWGWNKGKSCHMICDSSTDFEELHRIAQAIGLKRAWFQDDHAKKPIRNPALWHYDLTETMRAKAIACGAKAVTWREFAAINGRKMQAAS